MDYLQQKVVKRSVTIAGHTTSVSLEAPFWSQLQGIAAAQNLSLNSLIEQVDRQRGENNLSSALRLYVLTLLLEKSA